jgi:hypothetical protein
LFLQRVASIQRLKYLVGQSEIFQMMIERSQSHASKKPAPALSKSATDSSSHTAAGGTPASPRRQRSSSTVVQEEEETLQSELRCAVCSCFSACVQSRSRFLVGETMAITRLSAQPSCITATMRHYQLEGLNWMISLHDNGAC